MFVIQGQNIDWTRLSESEKQYLRAQGYVEGKRADVSKPKPNKYHAQRTQYNGEWYDSKAEAEYAAQLDCNPSVQWRLRQVVIPLGQDFKTRVDFVVGAMSVAAHEVKGVETLEFAKVRKLWPKYGPFDLHIIKGGNVEVIHGKD